MTDTWSLDPDRALPTDPHVRGVARELYASVAHLPLICMHGHVDVESIRANASFGDPTELFVIPDHYVRRMLVSQGYTNEQLGVAPAQRAGTTKHDHRAIWRLFCANWKLFRGTASRYWLKHELIEVFGITQRPSTENADEIYDQLVDQLQRPQFHIRPLFDSFNIEILSTTDLATSDLSAHADLARSGWGERVVPTFRPDALFHVDRPDWRANIEQLSAASGVAVVDYSSFLHALRARRSAFAQAGARASDHGHESADTTPLEASTARRIFDAALHGATDPASTRAFAANMLFETARMSLDDGMVMQLHPCVFRNHADTVFERLGPDQGFDIPVQAEFTRALRPVLNAFGTNPKFRMIVFTTDESAYSRELAPLAGVYPALRLGAPWWFLDAPGAIARFRAAVTETAGFYNTSGFVDDTRAFASIPARHDLARRLDAGYLARLVTSGMLDLDEAIETIRDLSYNLPKLAYAKRGAYG